MRLRRLCSCWRHCCRTQGSCTLLPPLKVLSSDWKYVRLWRHVVWRRQPTIPLLFKLFFSQSVFRQLLHNSRNPEVVVVHCCHESNDEDDDEESSVRHKKRHARWRHNVVNYRSARALTTRSAWLHLATNPFRSHKIFRLDLESSLKFRSGEREEGGFLKRLKLRWKKNITLSRVERKRMVCTFVRVIPDVILRASVRNTNSHEETQSAIVSKLKKNSFFVVLYEVFDI